MVREKENKEEKAEKNIENAKRARGPGNLEEQSERVTLTS